MLAGIGSTESLAPQSIKMLFCCSCLSALLPADHRSVLTFCALKVTEHDGGMRAALNGVSGLTLFEWSDSCFFSFPRCWRVSMLDVPATIHICSRVCLASLAGMPQLNNATCLRFIAHKTADQNSNKHILHFTQVGSPTTAAALLTLSQVAASSSSGRTAALQALRSHVHQTAPKVLRHNTKPIRAGIQLHEELVRLQGTRLHVATDV